LVLTNFVTVAGVTVEIVAKKSVTVAAGSVVPVVVVVGVTSVTVDEKVTVEVDKTVVVYKVAVG